MPSFTDDLFIALQRLLPQHLLSRLIGKLAECRSKPLKNFLIRQFIDFYDINLSELDDPSANGYPDFNSFFTRPLRANARPIAPDSGALVSPADGFISQIGTLSQGNLVQAKGKHYSIAQLLGKPMESHCQRFADGLFTTIYLSPKDYHRVHMPVSAKLVSSCYIPGELFSVNQSTAQNINGLFARNERLVCIFESDNGYFAQVLVGAMLVAGIESTWHGHYKPKVTLFSPVTTEQVMLEKGAEMGRFKFGSTVILICEKKAIEWNHQLKAGDSVKMGQQIATLR